MVITPSTARRKRKPRQIRWSSITRKTNSRLTNLNPNQDDDNLLEPFRVFALHALLEQRQHILQDLHSGIQDIYSLGDLEVGASSIVQRLEVWIALLIEEKGSGVLGGGS